MGETVDVLVVGEYLYPCCCSAIERSLAGNYGSGKRGGGVSTLVCAVLDDRHTTDEDDEPKYNFVCKIDYTLLTLLLKV